ncbi:MAG: hypothetical protein J6D54_00655 [Olsenella sp.]|nr:hypothetical protein [Olsenella sp.]
MSSADLAVGGPGIAEGDTNSAESDLELAENDLELAEDAADLTDDARAMISAELAHVLSPDSDLAMVLSGDMSRSLSELPFADDVSPAAWNVSDASALAQMHQMFRLGGAAAAVTHTAGCSDVELEEAGLAHCEDAAVTNAVRAAFSAAPRYVLGRVSGFECPASQGSQGPCAGDPPAGALRLNELCEINPFAGTPWEDDSPEDDPWEDAIHRALEPLCREVVRLEAAGVHGFVAEGGHALLTGAAVRAIRQVSSRPVIATTTVSTVIADGLFADETPIDVEDRIRAEFQMLANVGATALGVEVPLGAEASLGCLERALPRLASLSAAEGMALCVRLRAGTQAPEGPRLARVLDGVARVACDANVRILSLGPGFSCADTASLVAALRPHVARRGWRLIG